MIASGKSTICQQGIEVNGQGCFILTMPHIGDVIRKHREDMDLSQRELGEKVEMTGQAISLIETGKSKPQGKTLRKIAAVFDTTAQQLRAETGAGIAEPAPSGMRGPPRDVMLAEHYQSVSAARTEDRELVARKGQMPVPRSGGSRQFVVTVDGDCQEPRYHSGDDVVFSVDALEREGIRDGASYYVELKDGTTTFKRVFVHPDNRELLILQAWNPHYPPREIHRDDVQMIARCLGRWEPDVTG